MKILFLILLSLSGLWILVVIARWILRIIHAVKHSSSIEEHSEAQRKAANKAVEEYLQDREKTQDDNFSKGESK